MQLNTFKTILSVIVLSSGIISCSKEKEVYYQEEAFKPDRISTQNADNSVLFNEDVKFLEIDRKLSFDSLKSQNFSKDPVIVTIESTCRQSSKAETMYGRIDFQNAAEIAVAKIVPDDILATVVEDTALCDFVIVTKNKTGSSNINRLFGVQVTNLLKFANLRTEIIQNDRVNFEDRALDEIEVPGYGIAKLVCSDFTKTQTGVQNTFSLESLRVLEPAILGRLSNSSQKCRILFKSTDDVQASALFTLDFPVQAAVVRGIVQTLPIKSSLTKPNVLKIEISNPNAFPIKMRIAKAKSSRFVIRPIYMYSAFPRIGRLQRSIVEFKSHAENTVIDGANIYFTIQGGETIKVDSIATRNLICEMGPKSVIEASALPLSDKLVPFYYAGNNYDYEMNSPVMFDLGNGSWEEVDMPLVGKTHDSPLSDLQYWNWPSNEQIKLAFGRVVDVWANLEEMNDVCN